MAYERDDAYVEVKDRIIEFRAKYPSGYLAVKEVRLVNAPASYLPAKTPKNGRQVPEQITAPQTYVMVIAQAFREPGDTSPGEGCAWEPIPGRTPYTRDSELQNAETSAWGRALIALGAADATRGIASANEVRARSYTHETDADGWPIGTRPAAPGRDAAPQAAPQPAPPARPQTPPAPAPIAEADPRQLAAWQGDIGACAPADTDDETALKTKLDSIYAVRNTILGDVRAGRLPAEAVQTHMADITRYGRELKTLLGLPVAS